MNKLLTKLVLAFTLSAMNFTAVAGSFDNALKGLSTTNRAGVYSGPAGSYASLGGFTVDGGGPASGVQLFSLTPPRLQTVGCMGIDAFLGGFEFIGGDQIKQLFENITAMAPGFVIHLVLKKLCPQCEDIVQAMEELAQAATQFNMDACNIATKLSDRIIEPGAENPNALKAFQTGIETATDFVKGDCVKLTASGETNQDFMKSLNSACQSASEAYKTVNELLDRKIESAPTPEGKTYLINKQLAEECARFGNCNTTWTFVRLVQMGGRLDQPESSDPKIFADHISERLFFMNVLGTSTVGTKTATTTNPDGTITRNKDFDPDTDSKKFKPTYSADSWYMMMMCGTDPRAYLDAATQNANGEFATQGNLRVGKTLQVYCRNFYNTQAAVALQVGSENGGVDSIDGVFTGEGKTPDGMINDDALSTIGLTSERIENKKLEAIANAASKFMQSRAVLACGDAIDYKTGCLNVELTTLDKVPELQIREGYLLQVYRLLMDAVKAIQTNDENGIPPESLALIQAVPFPLYQLINLSAIYPAYTIDTLDAVTGFIADTIVQAKMRSILDYYSAPGIPNLMPDSFMDRYTSAISALRLTMTERSQRFEASMTMQEAFIRSINTLQLSLQREVVSQDLLGNLQYSGAATTIVGSNSVRQNAGAAGSAQ